MVASLLSDRNPADDLISHGETPHYYSAGHSDIDGMLPLIR